MKKARKRPAVVQAYRLGEENSVVDGLTAEGEIRLRGDGSFEVFSPEAMGKQVRLHTQEITSSLILPAGHIRTVQNILKKTTVILRRNFTSSGQMKYLYGCTGIPCVLRYNISWSTNSLLFMRMTLINIFRRRCGDDSVCGKRCRDCLLQDFQR